MTLKEFALVVGATPTWKTPMDPGKRTILRGSMEDPVEASNLFEQFMGDEVEPRRVFIEQNAKYVSNLDV